MYNARHYDPEIARFVTADDRIDGEDTTQGWNRYSYVKNNPIIYKDPTGHDTSRDGGTMLADGILYLMKKTPDSGSARRGVESVGAMGVASGLINKTLANMTSIDAKSLGVKKEHAGLFNLGKKVGEVLETFVPNPLKKGWRVASEGTKSGVAEYNAQRHDIADGKLKEYSPGKIIKEAMISAGFALPNEVNSIAKTLRLDRWSEKFSDYSSKLIESANNGSIIRPITGESRLFNKLLDFQHQSQNIQTLHGIIGGASKATEQSVKTGRTINE